MLNAPQIFDNVGVSVCDSILESSSAGAATTAGDYNDGGVSNKAAKPVCEGDICSVLDQQPADFKVIMTRGHYERSFVADKNKEKRKGYDEHSHVG